MSRLTWLGELKPLFTKESHWGASYGLLRVRNACHIVEATTQFPSLFFLDCVIGVISYCSHR